MLKAFGKLLHPPVFEDREQSRMGALLHTIMLGAWLIPLSLVIGSLLLPVIKNMGIAIALVAVFIILFVSILARRGNVRLASIFFVLALTAIISYVSYGFGAQSRPYLLFFTWIIIIAGLLLGRNAATAAAVYFALLQATIIILIERSVIQPASVGTSSLGNILIFAVGFLLISNTLNLANKSIQDLIKQGRTSELELETANRELTSLMNTLEKRIADRTSDLEKANLQIEKRAGQFQTISRITQAIISSQNLQSLLPQLSQVISQQFGFYHIGIFLIDPNKTFAVLSASNSEGGARMLARSHKLRVGQMGIVGNVAKTGKLRIALDTGADAIYFNNQDLPATRSEMALPLLQANGEIIGVLDIQSDAPNAFRQDEMEILTILAEQVSIAIANARQYEETRRALNEAEIFYRRELKAGWEKFARSQKLAGIRRRSMKSSFLAEPLDLPGAKEVVRSGAVYQDKADTSDGTQLTMPVKLRGEVVGLLNLKAGKNREWSPDEMDIITAIIERAALAVENARLLEESRRIAEKERAISEISVKIGQSAEIETILRTAVRELGAQINDAQVTVEIESAQE